MSNFATQFKPLKKAPKGVSHDKSARPIIGEALPPPSLPPNRYELKTTN